jgi:hypothetical protein
MTKELCWEEKYDGKYCKNYRLKYKNKCYVHYDYKENVYFSFFKSLMIMFILTYISYIVYVDNNRYLNTDNIQIFFESLKEYLIQLYKLDKNIILLYVKSLDILIMKYYNIISIYISKYPIN